MTRKHEANIKKSKWINIQLAIIAVLSFSYFMYEIHMYSEPSKDIAVFTPKADNNSDDPDIMYDGVEVYRDPVVEIKKVAKINEAIPVKVDNNTPDIPEKDEPVKDEPEVTDQPKTDKGADKTKTPATKGTGEAKNKVTKSEGTRTKFTVDFLPVFPGCDRYSSNNERAACFEKKVKRLILKKFDNGLGEELGLKGRQRIDLHFEIDENGIVSNIKARSNKKIFDLEKEAIRVAKKLPKMEPARAGKRNVKMSYSIPIIFDAR